MTENSEKGSETYLHIDNFLPKKLLKLLIDYQNYLNEHSTHIKHFSCVAYPKCYWAMRIILDTQCVLKFGDICIWDLCRQMEFCL